MALPKGVSGNPTGRPKAAFGFAARVREHGPAALEKVVAALEHKDPWVRLKAAEMLLDRGYGKPTQHMAVTGEDGGPIVTLNVTPADEAAAAAIVAALAQHGDTSGAGADHPEAGGD